MVGWTCITQSFSTRSTVLQTPSLIFPTIWSPPSLATCPPAITYHAIVVCSGRLLLRKRLQRSIFLCASVWCGTFFVCRAHKKWKTMTYLQIWYVRKTKKNVWTGPVFTGKTRKTKKMCEICFYVHVLRALGTPHSTEETLFSFIPARSQQRTRHHAAANELLQLC